jgi:hypothetical protein
MIDTVQLYQLSKGNHGALQFLIALCSGPVEDLVAATIIFPKVERCDIKGTDLYVLWSDLSGKNNRLAAHLCEHVPDAILKDACSRQDYSGRNLVEKYVKDFYELERKTTAHDL